MEMRGWRVSVSWTNAVSGTDMGGEDRIPSLGPDARSGTFPVISSEAFCLGR